MATKAELKVKIEKLEKVIASGLLPPALQDGAKKDLEKLKEEFESAEEAHEPKKEETPAKAEKKAPAKKHVKAEPKKKAEHTVNKEKKTVTVNGKEISVDDCEEVLEAWYSKMDKAKKAGAKFAKKSNSTVIGDKLASAGEKALHSIPKDKLEAKPALVTAKLQKLSKLMTEIATVLDELTGEKDASKEIKEFTKQVTKFIAKIKSAK